MRIVFLTFGDEQIASSRTRVFQYLPFLDKENIFYRILITRCALPIKGFFSYVKFWLCNAWIGLRLLFMANFYEIIFIQKVMLPRFYLRLLKFFKCKLVFDFDDAVYIVPKSRGIANFPLEKKQDYSRFQTVVSMSDLVVLENKFTEEYAKKYSTKILRIIGPMDTLRYSPVQNGNKNSEKIVIGWIGSPTTTVYLEPIIPVFEKISLQYKNVRFKLIGASPVLSSRVKVCQVPWSLETEVEELREFDIGIMPLPDDEWTRGKGGYKLLQYMAMGIPSVASPVGVNAELIQNGFNGFLVKDEIEWYEKFSLLIDDSQRRTELGMNARKLVEEKYSFHVAAPQLISKLYQIVQCVKRIEGQDRDNVKKERD